MSWHLKTIRPKGDVSVNKNVTHLGFTDETKQGHLQSVSEEIASACNGTSVNVFYWKKKNPSLIQ